MPHSRIRDFATIASEIIDSQVIGQLTVNEDAVPPWFWRDIFRKDDLQWAGYIKGEALFFGLNLEFTPAWRRAYRKIRRDLPRFSMLLRRYPRYRWDWVGKPGMLARNPPDRRLAEKTQVGQVDVATWVIELEDILERKIMWSLKVPMRPQLRIMNQIGSANSLSNSASVRENIQQVVNELEPLVAFLR